MIGYKNLGGKVMRSEWAVLALMRFFLAFVVLNRHLMMVYSDGNDIFGLKEFGSFSAVVGFFIISGYSIHFSIKREEDGFYIRRIRRIYPTYFVALGLALLSNDLLPENRLSGLLMCKKEDWTQFLLHLVCLHLVVRPVIFDIITAWSLGIEEWCYLFAPVFKRLRNEVIWIILVGSAVFWICWPKVMLGSNVILGNNFLPHLALAWAWLLGWMMKDNRGKLFLVCIFVLLPGALLHTNLTQDQGSLSVFTVGGTVMMIIFADRIKLTEPMQKVGLWLGDISYPLYILHFPILRLVKYTMPEARLIDYVIIIFGVSILVYYIVDKPIRVKRKE
jgi:peptidoglycan/LPS O-acetylase OafA/YrhL